MTGASQQKLQSLKQKERICNVVMRLPNMQHVQGPSSQGTHEDLIADLCCVLLGMYGPSNQYLRATAMDATFLSSVLAKRFEEWIRLLPMDCQVCFEPTSDHLSMICDLCDRQNES